MSKYMQTAGLPALWQNIMHNMASPFNMIDKVITSISTQHTTPTACSKLHTFMPDFRTNWLHMSQLFAERDFSKNLEEDNY